jgi:transporter family protein
MMGVSRPCKFGVVTLKGLILIGVETLFGTLVGDLAYYAAMKDGQCAQVSIILAASPAITILLSVWLLREKLDVLSLSGAVLTILGVIIAGL